MLKSNLRTWQKVKLPWIEDGRTDESKKDETGNNSGLHESLIRPLCINVTLQAEADVSESKRKDSWYITVNPHMSTQVNT